MAASSSCVLAAAALLLLLAGSSSSAAAAAGQQKETRMRVYWHDVVTGPNSTVAKVAEAPTSRASSTVFGTVYVIDDPLTDGPNLTSSRLVGRAQGMYVSAGKESMSLLMAMSFVFAGDGPYNGSSVAVFGPNPARPVREIPVVGGTGVFRFARGYCLATTYWYNSAGDATVQYDIHLHHE
uniref:Dirigent protein n=1 Tax=Oryza punctata TaxID=4537 RepID=A0A0E0MD45_ORYPU